MDKRPNVVVIMSDQHNPHVGGYAGDAVVQTPNLDSLVKSGVRFSAAYCAYPLCVPSRMAFMTARYPSDIGGWDNGSQLPSDVPTFAHALGAAGYEAVLCGRMHFIGPDQFHGFEKRIFGDCDDAVTPEIIGRGYNRTNGQTRYAVEVAGHGRTGFQAYDRIVTDKACAFIKSRRGQDRPYCLVVGYMLPHNPLICSREWFDYYMAKAPMPSLPDEMSLSQMHAAIRLWRQRRGVDALTPEQHHRALAAYYGLVSEMDANIGRVVDAVRSSPGGEDAVIIYCSDHGDHAGEHGMWWKSSHFEGSAGVPLIVSSPGRFGAGRKVDAVVSLIDVGPTILEIAGAGPLPDVSGRSLCGLLKQSGEAADWPNEIFCEYLGAHGDKPSCMIRSGPWKLIYYSEFDSYLLFNLDEDPHELHDRAADAACQSIAQALLAKIHRRWSAARMAEGAARQRRAHKIIGSCGHLAMPHEIEGLPDLSSENAFDFEQVPNWHEIRQRIHSSTTSPPE